MGWPDIFFFVIHPTRASCIPTLLPSPLYLSYTHTHPDTQYVLSLFPSRFSSSSHFLSPFWAVQKREHSRIWLFFGSFLFSSPTVFLCENKASDWLAPSECALSHIHTHTWIPVSLPSSSSSPRPLVLFPFHVNVAWRVGVCILPAKKKKERKHIVGIQPSLFPESWFLRLLFLPLSLLSIFFEAGLRTFFPGHCWDRDKYTWRCTWYFGSSTHSRTHLLIHAVAFLHKPNHVLSFVFHVQSKHGPVLYLLSFSLVGSIARNQPTFCWSPPPSIAAINVAQHAFHSFFVGSFLVQER